MPQLADLLSRSTLAAVACWAFAAADAFWFHRFQPEVELSLFYAGLAAVGLPGAIRIGAQSVKP